MKRFALIAALFSFSALASVTPAQMRQIHEAAKLAMYESGADARNNPIMYSVRVVDQLGSRARVAFSYNEDAFGVKDCTFYYDLATMNTVARSVLCR